MIPRSLCSSGVWESPFEQELAQNVFRIPSATYRGTIAEHFEGNVMEDSVVALSAGASLVSVVNLCAYYSFPGSKIYKIRALFDLMLLEAKNAEELKHILEGGISESETTQSLMVSNSI